MSEGGSEQDALARTAQVGLTPSYFFQMQRTTQLEFRAVLTGGAYEVELVPV